MNAPEQVQLGLVRDLPGERYHSIEAMSAGGLKRMRQSPAHFYGLQIDPNRPTPGEPTAAMKNGTLVHCCTGRFHPTWWRDDSDRTQQERTLCVRRREHQAVAVGAAGAIHQGDQVTPLRYFFGMYRIYRASAHGVLFSFLQAWRDASARVQF